MMGAYPPRVPLSADASFNAGIDQAVQVVADRARQWQMARERRRDDNPAGVIETELRKLADELHRHRR